MKITEDFLLLTVLVFWGYLFITAIVIIGFKHRIEEIEKEISRGYE